MPYVHNAHGYVRSTIFGSIYFQENAAVKHDTRGEKKGPNACQHLASKVSNFPR